MPTLVLPPRMTRDSIELSRAGSFAGWKVERLASWRAPEWLRNEDVVLYGEPLFAEAITQQLELALIEPPLSWLQELSFQATKRRVRLATVGEARQITAPMFIKPADDKSFPAKVYPSGKALPDRTIASDSGFVLVSEPIRWTLEIRCFILDRVIRTLSAYKRNGQVLVDEWAADAGEIQSGRDFLEPVLKQIDLPPSVVVDIGLTSDRGWAIVEANASWGSGIYGSDPNEVLAVIRRATIRKKDLCEEDRRWTIERG